MFLLQQYNTIAKVAKENHATIVAVSKTKPIEDILEAYNFGVRDFGENKINELLEKQKQLPSDIKWHLIGHLQSNKVKQIVPFIYLIHSVDSISLLEKINNEAVKINKVVAVLLQIHIAQEEHKYGFNLNVVEEYFKENKFKEFQNVQICGFMGMATYTENKSQIQKEFSTLNNLFKKIKNDYSNKYPHFKILSMGMSGDYTIALENGSNMIRVGSSIF